MRQLNETHDASLRSRVECSVFPIQNLPFGAFRRRASTEVFRVGVAVGDQILAAGLASANLGAI